MSTNLLRPPNILKLGRVINQVLCLPYVLARRQITYQTGGRIKAVYSGYYNEIIFQDEVSCPGIICYSAIITDDILNSHKFLLSNRYKFCTWHDNCAAVVCTKKTVGDLYKNKDAVSWSYEYMNSHYKAKTVSCPS